jgi:hypothetical protein
MQAQMGNITRYIRKNLETSLLFSVSHHPYSVVLPTFVTMSFHNGRDRSVGGNSGQSYQNEINNA